MIEHVKYKKIIQSVNNDYPWFDTSFNMNIYRGCNQGCIYCDSRSECYQVDEFDRIRVKKDAPTMVFNELKTKRKQGIISMGGMSDPYNKFENTLQYTRLILQHISQFKFGVFVITKNKSVTRDIDYFKKIKRDNVCNIAITVTTADDELAKKIEPGSSTTNERFAAIKNLRENKIFSGVMMMPILPYINDSFKNIHDIVLKAKEVDAIYIYPSFGVTLRGNQRDYFYSKISVSMKRKYENTFGDSYMCLSPKNKELKKYFCSLCEEYGILYKMADIIRAQKESIIHKQISLF